MSGQDRQPALPDWVTLDPCKVFFIAERKVSPKLEAALRTDAGLDALTAVHAVRRLLRSSVDGVANGLVEAVGLPSSRQLRRLQAALDRAEEGRRA